MTELVQELMVPNEAARWFRRSPSWLRQQTDLLRLGGPNGQPLYHVRICRAYVLGRLCALTGEDLRQVQRRALAADCGVPVEPLLPGSSRTGNRADEPAETAA